MTAAERDVRNPDGTRGAVGEAGPMRAVVRHRYGAADVLGLDEVAVPTIADDEVLVRVRAAGLDRGTWHMMTGVPYLGRLAWGLRRPKQPVLGRDLAGTVVAVGAAVTRIAVGDAVFGTGRGSFAEYAAAPQERLALIPPRASFEQAAVLPVSGLTALHAVDAGKVRAGNRVLVVGASGGVGSYAVQIAKALGAEVTGVCSTAKVDLVRSLGADHVIDYSREDVPRDGSFDVVVDIGGSRPVSRLRRALTPRGTLVIVGGEGGGTWTGGIHRQLLAAARSPFLRQRLVMVLPDEHFRGLERLAGLVESGAVTPSIDCTYPLDQAPEAMRRLEAGQVRGKVAITARGAGTDPS